MPCTPNPTTGFLMYVYKSEIVMLDMTIEDGAKLIVSAGLVAPEYRRQRMTNGGKPAQKSALSNASSATEPQPVAQPARSSRTASSRPNR